VSEIKYPTIAEILRRRLQAEFPATLADQIVPVIVLENDRPEWPFLSGELLCIQTVVATTTTALNELQVVLYNPVGSRTLIVVENVWSTSLLNDSGSQEGATNPFLLRVAELSTWDLQATVPNLRDFRYDVGPAGGAGIRSGIAQFATRDSAVEDGTRIGTMRRLHSQRASTATHDQQCDSDLPTPVVVAPGSGLSLHLPVRTVAGSTWELRATYAWRERPFSSWEGIMVPAS